MNNQNRRPMPYGKRRRRRQTLRTVLIVLGCVLVALVLAFMIIGNLLLDAVDAPDTEDEEREEETAEPVATLPRAKQIGGYPILAETSDTTTFATRLSALTAEGATAVSLPLNDADNRLTYRSEIAVQLGLQGATERTVTVGQVVKIAKDSGVYVSGVYTLTAFSEENDLARSVALSHATAILAEAIRAGMDDVLLVIPDWNGDRAEELIRFAEGIRALEKGAVIGLALGETALEGEDPTALLERLNGAMNYLALDARGAEGEDPVSAADEMIHDPKYHYDLLYYEMRLLLSDGVDAAERAAIIAKAEENGIHNWQILIKT